MNKFFARLYEFFYYSSPFSDDVFNENLYFGLSLFAIISSVAICFTFYYIINSPRFSKWYHWLVHLAANSIINYLFSVIYLKKVFFVFGYDYTSEYYLFGLAQAGISFILFLIFTYCIRWWSTNCSTTPIPQ